MKTGKLILALVFLMLFADASMAAKWKAKHVVLIWEPTCAFTCNHATIQSRPLMGQQGSQGLGFCQRY